MPTFARLGVRWARRFTVPRIPVATATVTAAAAVAAATAAGARAEPSAAVADLLGSIVASLDRIDALHVSVKVAEDTSETIVNWSATHSVTTECLHQPETVEELEALVQASHAAGRKLRVVGSAISPNGFGFSEGEMVTLASCDRVISVDPERRQVTVQAGARVQQVVDVLREHSLTLPNYASIAEQQVGGFVAVGAHGTGAQLPTVDAQVVRMKLVTPARGTIELSRTSEPELFELAKVGLGALGVIAEVTLQCVAAHQLLEHTFVMSGADIR